MVKFEALLKTEKKVIDIEISVSKVNGVFYISDCTSSFVSTKVTIQDNTDTESTAVGDRDHTVIEDMKHIAGKIVAEEAKELEPVE